MRQVNLMLHPDPLGREITLGGRPFQIAAMRIIFQGADVGEAFC